jgi:uncharacterized protein YdhG (YjbR/CyaY superfamily)
MKKGKPSTWKSAAKANGRATTVDEYLAAVPEPARTTLNKVRAAIRAAAPREASETISYGIPAFRHNGVLVWYAAFAKHCSFFPTASVIEEFEDDLKGYTLSKGTIQFPTNKPLPAALIKKMVKARVAQIESKKRG